MKSLFIFICAISVLMISCKKDQQRPVISNNAPIKKYAVRFKGGIFSQYSTGIGVRNAKALLSTQRTDALSDTTSLLAAGVNKFYYVVYDTSGHEIERQSNTYSQGVVIHHKYIGNGYIYAQGFNSSQQSSFDTITDSLASGTYTIVIVAASINLSSGDYRVANYAPGYNDFYIDTQQEEGFHGYTTFSPLSSANFQYDWGLDAIPNSGDTYFYKGTLTVGTQNIEQTYVLNRVVGELEINLEDVGLGSGGSFYVTLENEYMGLSLNNLLPFSEAEALAINLPIDSTQSGQTNTTFYQYIINTASPINVTLTYVDPNNNGFNKTINGVQFARNVKTILTGKILDTVQTNSIKKATASVTPGSRVIHF